MKFWTRQHFIDNRIISPNLTNTNGLYIVNVIFIDNCSYCILFYYIRVKNLFFFREKGENVMGYLYTV